MHLRALAAAALAMTAPWASAIDCGVDHFEQPRTMADLPARIRERVLQHGAVANPGERWIVGDVVDKDYKGLPSRRLSVAAVGQHHAFVAIVIGGGPWRFEGWRFDRRNGDWRGGNDPSLGPSATLPQLLHAACDGYPQPFQGQPESVSGVVTSKGSVVLTVNDELGSIAYRLDRGQPGIRFLHSGLPLTTLAGAALRNRLVRAQAAMSPSDETRSLVVEYLHALDTDAPVRPSR